MATYTQRVQTMLTREQYERLLLLADQERKPLSVLIREAVEEKYLAPAAQERRQQALAKLLALNAPVDEWPQIEREIEQGALDE